MIFEGVSKALGYLLISLIVYFAWYTAQENASKKGIKPTIIKGLLWCASVALVSTVSLGDPSCLNYDEDNRGRICYEYADDGYNPTMEQRFANFAYIMTLIYIPVVFGALDGEKKKKQP